jgi:hypothetical protein
MSALRAEKKKNFTTEITEPQRNENQNESVLDGEKG